MKNFFRGKNSFPKELNIHFNMNTVAFFSIATNSIHTPLTEQTIPAYAENNILSKKNQIHTVSYYIL